MGMSSYAKKASRNNTNKRLFYVLMAFVIVMVAIVFRLAYLQLFKADELQELAISQWTSDTTVSARRGKITDRNGTVLAQSGTAETVIIMPNSIDSSSREKVAHTLADILQLDYEDVLKKVSKTNVNQVNIKRQVSEDQANAIRAQMLTGVSFSIETKRYYPMKSFAVQLLGYTNMDGDGQEGLEAEYNKYLAGMQGKIVAETDQRGREIPYGAEQYVPAQDGSNLVLTIDAVIQSSLENALSQAVQVNNGKSAQGIVMRPSTGEILALSTKPDFDLNEPPRSDIDQLRSLSRNRVVADAFEPGSIFKILTLASGLDAGVISQSSEFDCNGYLLVDGERIKCWKSSHGHQTLSKGVQNSCNPVFMTIALRLGIEKFYEYLSTFGIGSLTGIEVSGESVGIMRHVKYIKNVDIARIGFGQSIAATPIQLAMAAAACINGGNLMKPYIVKEIVSTDGTVIEQKEPVVVRRVISEDTSKQVRELLEGVVKGGSGKNAYIPGYHVGGKTGTAQKYENGVIAQGKNVASFIGFAPADDPQFLVIILVDEPKISSAVFGSTVAAPYVRSVLYDTLKYYGVKPRYDEDEKNIDLSVSVPNVAEMSLDDAKKALQDLKFTVTADGKGTVLNQVPQAGSVVPEGTGILLYLSEPDQDESEVGTTVPDVTGEKIAQAYEKLTAAGFEVQVEGDPLGRVIYQDPVAGSDAQPGMAIVLTAAVNPD